MHFDARCIIMIIVLTPHVFECISANSKSAAHISVLICDIQAHIDIDIQIHMDMVVGVSVYAHS